MRKRRLLEPGAEYHVIAMANRGEFIFKSTEMKQLLLKVFMEAKEKYSFKVRNFCIMSNHIHFIITPEKEENLSKILQWILSVFAIRYNRRLGIFGHVWYDRFKSYILSNFQKLLHTFIYICENPVKAGLVNSCWDYSFSGLKHIQEKKYDLIDPPDPSTYLMLFSLSEADRFISSG